MNQHSPLCDYSQLGDINHLQTIRRLLFTHDLQNMLIRLYLLLAAIAPYALADVEFTSPAAGATLQGGSTIKVAWKDSGSKPPITDLQGYQLFLCAGGNDDKSFVGAW